MIDDQAELRYEVKLVCSSFDLSWLETELRLHPAGCRQLHPPRRVQSVYLDTHDGRALSENIAGISERQKLRFRWYGEDASEVAGTLEQKIRVNAVGRKEMLRVEQPLRIEGADRMEFLAALRAQCPAQWRGRLDGLEPAQWIRYEREYFSTFHTDLRITVDRQIRTVDLREQRSFDSTRPSLDVDAVIIELKGPMESGDAIQEFLKHLPSLVSKSSKFVLASAPTQFMG